MFNWDELARLHAQSLEIEKMEAVACQQDELAKLHAIAKEIEKSERDLKLFQSIDRFKVASGVVVPSVTGMSENERASFVSGSIPKEICDVLSGRISKEIRDSALGLGSMSEIAAASVRDIGLHSEQSAAKYFSDQSNMKAACAAFDVAAYVPQSTLDAICGRISRSALDDMLGGSGKASVAAMSGSLSREIRNSALGLGSMPEIAAASVRDIGLHSEQSAAKYFSDQSNMKAACTAFDVAAYVPQSTLDAICGRISRSALDDMLGDSGKASVAAMSGSLSREIRNIFPGYSSQAALAAVSGNLSTELRDAIAGSESQSALSAILGFSHAELTGSANLPKEIIDAISGSSAQAAFAASIFGDIAQQDWFVNWKSRTAVLAFDLLEAHNDDNAEEVERILSSEHFGIDVIRAALDLAQMEDEERYAARDAEIESIKSELASALNKLKEIHSGASKRADAGDKAIFIAWVRDGNITVLNISSLLNDYKATWPLSRNYENSTLKKWYKEAMPHVEFARGRPVKA